VNGKAYFPKPPLVALTESIEALVSPDAIGGFNIPPGVYPCVLPGLTTAGKILDDVRFDVSSTLADQATFVTYITNPT